MTWEAVRRLLYRAGVVLLVVFIAPFIVFAVPQVVGAEYGYVVLSGSMQPTLSPGDVVIANDVPAERIQEGDIIVFDPHTAHQRADAERVTHRVVAVVHKDGQRYFRTKGDANEEPDQHLVPAGDVVGRVMFSIPYIGRVIRFGSTDTGIVALVIVPSVLLIVNEVWTFVKAAEQNQSTDNPSASDDTDGG